MKKMTLWLGSITLAFTAAAVNAQNTGAAATAAPHAAAASNATPDTAAVPVANAPVSSSLASDEGAPPAGEAQYYSRAQVGDAPVQTTGASHADGDSYGTSFYGSSAAGHRTATALMNRTADKP